MFDILSTATITERRVQRGAITALLYCISTSFPAVRTASESQREKERVRERREAVVSEKSPGGQEGHLLLFSAGT